MADPLMSRFRAAAAGKRVAELVREPELSGFSQSAIGRWLSGDIATLNTRAAEAVTAWLNRQAQKHETPPTGGGDAYQRGLLDAAAAMSETVAAIIRQAQGVTPSDAARMETRAREALVASRAAPPGKRARG